MTFDGSMVSDRWSHIQISFDPKAVRCKLILLEMRFRIVLVISHEIIYF